MCFTRGDAIDAGFDLAIFTFSGKPKVTFARVEMDADELKELSAKLT